MVSSRSISFSSICNRRTSGLVFGSYRRTYSARGFSLGARCQIRIERRYSQRRAPIFMSLLPAIGKPGVEVIGRPRGEIHQHYSTGATRAGRTSTRARFARSKPPYARRSARKRIHGRLQRASRRGRGSYWRAISRRRENAARARTCALVHA